MSLGVLCQGLQHADLDETPEASGGHRGLVQSPEQAHRPVQRTGVGVGAVLGDDQADQGEVVVLPEVLGAVLH